MNLLIDENFPLQLGKGFADNTIHATDIGKGLTDQDLWQAARERESILVTKDADFFDRLLMQGPPPKVIWIRTGNVKRKDLEEHFRFHWKTILKTLESSDLVQLFSDGVEGIHFEK